MMKEIALYFQENLPLNGNDFFCRYSVSKSCYSIEITCFKIYHSFKKTLSISVLKKGDYMKFGGNFGNAIRRFGGAMIVPVLLFPFFGIIVGIATLFKNEAIMGGIANPDSLWYQIWTLIENGGWTLFQNIELIFVIGLPISLAKKSAGHAVMSSVVTYLMFNYFIN